VIAGIEWLVEGRVLHVRYGGVFTLEDVKAASRNIEILVNQAGHEAGVHVIQDAAGSDEIDSSVFNFGEFQRHMYRHPLIQWTIVVDPDPNPVLRFIGTTLARILQAKFQVVKTLDEAKTVLLRHDDTLTIYPTLHASDDGVSGGGAM
jgi:hypothetical protein